MNVNGVHFNSQAASMSGFSGGSNPRLKALEQKLERLNKEKEEAVHNKDADRERELEREIQKVKNQIEQLKKKEKQKEKREEPNSSLSGGDEGQYVDVRA